MGLGPLPPAANILRIEVSGFKSQEPWANIMNFAWSGATPTTSTLTTIANQVSGLWVANVTARQTSDTELTGVKITDMTSNTGAQVETTWEIFGTNGEDPLPSSVAVLIDYPVNLRYRGGHPRTYLVAGGDGDLFTASGNWNVWNNAFLSAVASSWQAFTNGVSAISVGGTNVDHLKCIRYHHDGAYIIPPIQLDLPSFTISEIIASQRRRIGRKK